MSYLRRRPILACDKTGSFRIQQECRRLGGCPEVCHRIRRHAGHGRLGQAAFGYVVQPGTMRSPAGALLQAEGQRVGQGQETAF